MITPFTLHTLFVLLSVVVDVSRPVCVEVLSNTDAVVGKSMKLTCIFCMKREEVSSKTRVDWFFLPRVHENTTNRTPILQYVNGLPREVKGPWEGRLLWAGSTDLQDLSIHILNVTWDDSGIYQCQVFRQFVFDFFSPSINKTRTIDLRVIEIASNNTTAVYSEIMMYVLLVFLTCWLLLEMVYCYRKISKSDEQTETAKDYVALPSETHRDPRPVPLHVVTAPVTVTVTVTPHGTDLRETELLVLHPYAQLEEAELYT